MAENWAESQVVQIPFFGINRDSHVLHPTVEKVLNGILKKLLDPLSIWLCSKFEGNLRKDLPFQNDFICPLDHKLQ